MMSRGILGVVVLGIVLGLAGGILMFVWRITEYLTEMSAGIVLGLLVAALLMGVSILPMVYLLNRSREADKVEFMTAFSRQRPSNPRFDVTFPDPGSQKPQRPGFDFDRAFRLGQLPTPEELGIDVDDF